MKGKDHDSRALGNLSRYVARSRMNSSRTDRETQRRKIATHRNRSRQGVGMIIGGVLLAAILFTSVYYYFFVIMEGQVIRGETDAKIQQLENSKKLENIEVTSFKNEATDTINVRVKNTGTIPIKIDYVITYDKSSIPVDSDAISEKKDIGLNPGHDVVVDSGIAADKSKTYRIDAITERGNIVTAMWPLAEGGGQGGSENTVSSGSLQIDLKSFGVIFPNSRARDLVDQTGWQVTFGDGKGYPAFRLPGSSVPWNANATSQLQPEVLVVRVRNIDPSGEEMTMHANTALGITLNAPNHHQQSPGLYLCYANSELGTFEPYSEKTTRKVILANAFGSNIPDDYGWTYLYFCDAKPGTTQGHESVTDWQARRYSSDLNPVVLAARGEFEKTLTEYGQTIPSQAITVTDDRLIVCLKNTGELIAERCRTTPGPSDKYRGSVGDEVWVHLSGPIVSAPYNTRAIWINPDGQAQNLLPTAAATTNPFSFVIPSSKPDGTPITDNEYYIIQILDKNDNIHSMTFKVIP